MTDARSIAAWLRERARLLIEAANAIDETSATTTDLERIRRFLAYGVKRRVAEIMRGTSLSQAEVRRVLKEHPNEFTQTGNGWWSEHQH